VRYDFLLDKIRGETYTSVLGTGEVWYVGKVTINMSGDLFFRCFVAVARGWCDDVLSLPDFLDPFHEMPLPRNCTPAGVVDEVWSWRFKVKCVWRAWSGGVSRTLRLRL